MRQRRFTEAVIDLIIREGRPLTRNRDRLLLTRRQVVALHERGLIDDKLAALAESATPAVAVVKDGVITVFRATRRINRSPDHRRRRLRRRRQ